VGKIIGICNQKGGTGKTTTAINLSSFLGLSGKKTLLIDMDPQGNATSGTGSVPQEGERPSVYELLVGESTFHEAVWATPYANLSLIPSSVGLTGAEIELVELEDRELRLRRVIDQEKENFDYIILDAPPSLGLLTINVLSAADSILIPIQCEYYALEGLSKLVNTIDLIRERLNTKISIEGILLTMADFRTRLTMQVIEEVKKFFGDKVCTTIIPRNVTLAEAPSFGKPIYFYDHQCVGAKAYFNLAKEILGEEANFVYKKAEPKVEQVERQII